MWQLLWIVGASAGDLPVESEDVDAVPGRLYYPAAPGGGPDLEGGPWPLVAFMHGWLGNVDLYDEACTAVASEGFVVASIDTQTGLFLDIPSFAQDTHDLLTVIEQTSDTPGAAWEGLVDGGDLIALGHSMGGATLGSLVALEPRVRTVVGFHPYVGVDAGYRAMDAFDGAALYIAGDEDTTAPTAMALEWHQTADQAARSLFVEIGGAGHQTVTDPGWWSEGSLAFDRQLTIVSQLAAAFLASEVRGEEDRWEELVGVDRPPELIEVRSAGRVPVLVGGLVDDTLSLDVAGRPSGTAVLLASHDAEMSEPVELGAVELVDGLGPFDLPLDGWSGDLYVQSVVDDTESRTLALITDTESPDPETQTGTGTGTTSTSAADGDAPATPQGDTGGGGCATAPRLNGAGWLRVLGRR